jgi:mRNA-degrading endonuclease RelE of RelBE toxin-antitoxin system
MKFELVATEFFIRQIEKLDKKSKNQIKEKIQLISSKRFKC